MIAMGRSEIFSIVTEGDTYSASDEGGGSVQCYITTTIETTEGICFYPGDEGRMKRFGICELAVTKKMKTVLRTWATMNGSCGRFSFGVWSCRGGESKGKGMG